MVARASVAMNAIDTAANATQHPLKSRAPRLPLPCDGDYPVDAKVTQALTGARSPDLPECRPSGCLLYATGPGRDSSGDPPSRRNALALRVARRLCRIPGLCAGMAELVEHGLAQVGVVSSSLVSCCNTPRCALT